MADHLACRSHTHAARQFQIAPRCHAIKEPGRELIARPCRIDGRDARDRHLDPGCALEDLHRLARMGADHQIADRRRPRQGLVQIICLVKRQPFFVVADDVIHLGLNKRQEIGAVTIDAERIAERDAHTAPALATLIGGGGKGGFPLGLVVEIALQKQPARIARNTCVYIARVEIGTCAQIGVHRPLPIGRDEDHRA